MSNKVNLLPIVVQVVFPNLCISSCCINDTLKTHVQLLIEVLLIYFSVNYFNLICQSNDNLDLLGSSDKFTYAS